jgi:hypothetical protein
MKISNQDLKAIKRDIIQDAKFPEGARSNLS